jgi:hypothetical protein
MSLRKVGLTYLKWKAALKNGERRKSVLLGGSKHVTTLPAVMNSAVQLQLG